MKIKVTDNNLNININNNNKILPNEYIDYSLNETELYNTERANCNNVRINITINTICSNVLYNKATEIVYGEGTNYVNRFLNQENHLPSEVSYLYGRNKYESFSQMIHDTQLTNNGYTYYCGLDILNNHILRNKTSKIISGVNTDKNKTNNFNTISDIIRNSKGDNLKPIRHLYDKKDIMSFTESLKKNINEINGWFGFYNKTNLNVINNDENNQSFNKVICGQDDNKFIQFCPSSDLFSIIPKYNSYKQREELNWKYYLVYPSENIYDGFSFIDKDLKSLKILYYDDEYKTINGVNGMKIYSICKHGLNVGDLINVYTHTEGNTSKVLSNATVTEIINDFEFSINGVHKISDKYIDMKDSLKEGYDMNEVSSNVYTKDGKVFYAINNKLCIDKFDYLSFKKVVNGEEVYYYVRKFTKIKNDDESIPNSSIGQLAFSKNIYGDNLGEITYLDSININNYIDNLGRPLTSLYFILLKNNQGYKKWYSADYKADDVEYSHVFGKLSCGFKLSDYTVPLSFALIDNNNSLQYENIKCISNVKGFPKGIKNTINGKDDNEINVTEDEHFYGDICYFSNVDFSESIIDSSYYRFNTNQREYLGDEIQNVQNNPIGNVFYEEIISSDYDDNGFIVKKYPLKSLPNQQLNIVSPEGYYYKPLHEIKIKTYSNYVSKEEPYIYQKVNIEKYNEGLEILQNKIDGYDKYLIMHTDMIYCKIGDDVIIIDEHGVSHKSIVESVINKNCIIIGIDNTTFNYEQLPKCTLIRKKRSTPAYAKISIKDKMYYWRNIIQNGFDDYSFVEKYPYQNNSFYINRSINLFVKRQNDGTINKMTNKIFGVIEYEPHTAITEYIDNTHYTENEMIC